ncbi:cyclophilin ABH-like protein [Bodo saltans virus]|uniref:peptidylprolyl isomerase n=1 Tax=Bodo saltans virus TaxID=2024608 RepID=A0A2H4UTF4_9VIRU|nr:cyclophilin ABH-like protein [Bodo saltans virus]ATZ80220.1 cyclophilin ABH-like protein [Bodo saltans virus]
MLIIIILLIIGTLFFIYKYRQNQNNESVKSDNIEFDVEPKMKQKKKFISIPKKETKQKPKKETKQKPKQDLVYMDIGVNGEYAGKIIILLFSNIVPVTCRNFRTLCDNKSYQNSPFHRIIQDFMIQGGDFTNGNGTGGKSIYGSKFEDENFDILHDQPYLLSMANAGKDTNGSQFFITTKKTPHLDGKHVVFGKVVDGFDLIDQLNLIETDNNDRPIKNVTILNCGKM